MSNIVVETTIGVLGLTYLLIGGYFGIESYQYTIDANRYVNERRRIKYPLLNALLCGLTWPLRVNNIKYIKV